MTSREMTDRDFPDHERNNNHHNSEEADSNEGDEHDSDNLDSNASHTSTLAFYLRNSTFQRAFIRTGPLIQWFNSFAY